MKKGIYIALFFLFNACAVVKKTDKDNKVIKQIRFFKKNIKNDTIQFNRDSIFSNKKLTTRKYTKEGVLLENWVYNSSEELITKSIFTHNSFHRFLTNTVYDKNGISKKSYYFYNKKKQQVKVLTYTNDSVLISENHHKYRNGNMIALKGVFHKHNTGLLTTMKYDSNQNLIKSTSSGFYGANTVRCYNYDKNKRIILERFYKEGNVIETTTIYDQQDNIVQEIIKNKLLNKTETYKYTYVYDIHLNWISKKTYYNGEIRNLELREISYYQ